jgi:lysyl-tRNA synthetase class 1
MYWAEKVALEAKAQFRGPQLVSTGITPSGRLHLGHLLEVFIGEASFKALKVTGSKPRFIYIADDFDHLRKVPTYVPATFSKYIDMPLVFVPDPEGDKDKSYAQRYLDEFFESLDALEVDVERISQYQLYKNGTMTKAISTALDHVNDIRKILEKVSNRTLAPNWSPLNVLCKNCMRLNHSEVKSHNAKNHTVSYECDCGHADTADYSKGEAKLLWRVDWPAKWLSLGVTVEPFGKDHGSRGGSYDTGSLIIKDVFHSRPPIPVLYEHVYLKGFNSKMSSSVGNLVGIKEALEFIPPEVLRYLIMKRKPNRHLVFDPGEGLLQLIDEITKIREGKIEVDEGLKKALEFAKMSTNRLNVSFRHLINVIQAAQGEYDEIVRLLKRSKHIGKVFDETALRTEIKRAENWLEKYGPDEIKFEIQKELPKLSKPLSEKQKQLLQAIMEKLGKHKDAPDLHNFIYVHGKDLGLTPKETFEPIYQVLLSKTSGPKAGWFLSLLDSDFVIKRFKEAIKSR